MWYEVERSMKFVTLSPFHSECAVQSVYASCLYPEGLEFVFNRDCLFSLHITWFLVMCGYSEKLEEAFLLSKLIGQCGMCPSCWDYNLWIPT
ncbi:hypothetical protein Peur_051389 [Populus x canadensis]